jgi:RNA polymerase sigma-70 factor, ECF subfamily
MDQRDEEIMLEYQAGDTKAIEMIYQRYKSRVLNFSLRVLGNRAEAEDVTGEVFLTLFSHKYTYDPQAKFSTWLFTVARNRCISHIRKRKKMRSMWFTSNDSGTFEQMEIPDSRNLSREDLERKEAKLEVRRAISQLPFEQREAIVLREYHDMSYDQIRQRSRYL